MGIIAAKCRMWSLLRQGTGSGSLLLGGVVCFLAVLGQEELETVAVGVFPPGQGGRAWFAG